ncbi:MAG: hypothetical protein ACFWTT_04300 [Lactobacillus delbrueckii]
MENKTPVSRGKVIRSFILRTLLYSLILLGLIYLYEYYGFYPANPALQPHFIRLDLFV